MTAALEGGEWSAARPGRALPPGKTRYPLYRRLGGPQGRSGRAENLVPTGIRSRTVQPVVRRYTTELPGPLVKQGRDNLIQNGRSQWYIGRVRDTKITLKNLVRKCLDIDGLEGINVAANIMLR